MGLEPLQQQIGGNIRLLIGNPVRSVQGFESVLAGDVSDGVA
jgi:hypothetical protein